MAAYFTTDAGVALFEKEKETRVAAVMADVMVQRDAILLKLEQETTNRVRAAEEQSMADIRAVKERQIAETSAAKDEALANVNLIQQELTAKLSIAHEEAMSVMKANVKALEKQAVAEMEERLRFSFFFFLL